MPSFHSAKAQTFQTGAIRVPGLARAQNLSLRARTLGHLSALLQVGASPPTPITAAAAPDPPHSTGSPGLGSRPACTQQHMEPVLSCKGLLIPEGLGQGAPGPPHGRGSKGPSTCNLPPRSANRLRLGPSSVPVPRASPLDSWDEPPALPVAGATSGPPSSPRAQLAMLPSPPALLRPRGQWSAD